MPDLQIPIKVSCVVESAILDPDDVRDLLEGEGAYKPHTIVVDSDHAIYVEFGSGPATKGSKASGKNLFAELDRWAERKLGIKDPGRRKRAVRAIYHNIMEHGIPPQPYMRPAVHNVLDLLTPDWFEEGGTVKELAEMIAAEMKRLLEEHNTTYMGEIRDSIRVVEGEEDGDDRLEGISKEVWNSDDLGYDGKRKAVRYRWHPIRSTRYGSCSSTIRGSG